MLLHGRNLNQLSDIQLIEELIETAKDCGTFVLVAIDDEGKRANLERLRVTKKELLRRLEKNAQEATKEAADGAQESKEPVG